MYCAKSIDLAVLGGNAGQEEILGGIGAAAVHLPRAVCLNPAAADIPAVRARLDDLRSAGVLRAFVIDFPLGQGGRIGKLASAESLLRLGAVDEFDVVANIAAILRDDFGVFEAEVAPIVALGLPVKVIVETGYYPNDDGVLIRAADWCAAIGAYAIKTSTGVLENIDNETKRRHVALWASHIRDRGYQLAIKDSGGKKTRGDIELSLASGATIIGSSRVIE